MINGSLQVFLLAINATLDFLLVGGDIGQFRFSVVSFIDWWSKRTSPVSSSFVECSQNDRWLVIVEP